MKKLFLLFMLVSTAMPLLVFGQAALSNVHIEPSVVPTIAEVVQTVEPAVAPAKDVPLEWRVFVQQIMTNGGMVLLAFLLSKIPGPVGVWLKKIMDFLMANIVHKK